MSERANAVKCPMCFKHFSSPLIFSHVQHCNGTKSNETSSGHATEKTSAPNLLKRSSPWSQFPNSRKLGKKEEAETSSKNAGVGCHGPNTLNVSTTSKLQTTGFPRPLAEMARPATLEEFVGQVKVVGRETSLFQLINNNITPSMIFWGPPGCGKTTLANIIACKARASPNKNPVRFVKLSATNTGKADVQAIIRVAANEKKMFQRRTILFIDEIHRFNKLQQDTFLPHVENGTIVLLGATTENPSFSLNSALLSRCRVVVLNKLSPSDVESVLTRAVKMLLPNADVISHKLTTDEIDTGSDKEIVIYQSALQLLANVCDGDARTALNGLQIAVESLKSSDGKQVIDDALINKSLERSHVLYDRSGDQHYEVISALHKSIRGGDDNAALYWLTRMIVGGEDPKFIARRLIRIASEDVGLADSNALNLAVSTYHAVIYIGLPECDASLAQCVVYLSRAPKSVEAYLALEKAKSCIKDCKGAIPSVPLHLRNASTKLMKDLGYGAGYKYEYDPDQTYLPAELKGVNFFVTG
ncbi:ATPase WRNIP1-like [Clavelina lepadiformis]|uniref:ATPase WRNIP1-like n=1 Tax=Clavelina lepadiformis TaxID=159417 RepID=UPI0040423201